jgi:hypothetical protein
MNDPYPPRARSARRDQPVLIHQVHDVDLRQPVQHGAGYQAQGSILLPADSCILRNIGWRCRDRRVNVRFAPEAAVQSGLQTWRWCTFN